VKIKRIPNHVNKKTRSGTARTIAVFAAAVLQMERPVPAASSSITKPGVRPAGGKAFRSFIVSLNGFM